MSEATNSATDVALAKVLEMATATGNFVVEQTPDVVQQLIAYKTVMYAVQGGLFATVTALCAYGIYRACKTDDEDVIIPALLIVGGLGLFSAGFAIANLMLLLKITLAPKVWLLEYAASLIR